MPSTSAAMYRTTLLRCSASALLMNSVLMMSVFVSGMIILGMPSAYKPFPIAKSADTATFPGFKFSATSLAICLSSSGLKVLAIIWD